MGSSVAPKGTSKEALEDLIVDYVEKYQRKNGYAPSREEIASYFDRSITYVQMLITGLCRVKRLRKIKGRARSLHVVKEDA